MSATTGPVRVEPAADTPPPPATAWRVELAWLAGTMAAAVLVAAFVLRLWDARLHVPIFGTDGDTVFSLMTVKDAITSTWIQVNDQLAAPAGQNLLDFSALGPETLQYLIVKAFSPVSTEVAAVGNAFYLLTFALIAGTAFVVLRALSISRLVSAAIAVLFAVLPYHFLRGQAHLMLGAYEAVPLGAFLVLSVLTGRRRLQRRPGAGRGPRAWLTRTTLLTLACAVVIGSTSVYYAIFTLMLLVIATAVAALAERDRKRLYEGAALTALILGVLLVNLTPNIVYRAVNGPNPEVAKRAPMESEIYSLSIAHLTMPTRGHRLKPLADLKARYETTTPLPNGGMATLGAVGTVGLVAGLLFVLVGALRGRPFSARGRLAQAAGLSALLGVLIGTAGGISSLVAYLLTPQVRAWDRISVFIAFFSLVVVAVLLDLLRRHLAARRRGTLLAGVAVGAVAVIGVLDQTSPSFAPNYTLTNADWTSDARFVKAIEQRLPGEAEIFQLPYVGFPEVPPVNAMGAYDHGRGYLHTKRLRFSWGAMMGRDEEWSGELADAAPSQVLASVAAAGFEGLWIDRAGYADGGKAIEAAATQIVGAPPLVSENGRLAFYDLRGYAGALQADVGQPAFAALKRATLDPADLAWGDGFFEAETSGLERYRWMAPNGVIGVGNEDDRPRTLIFRARIASGGRGTLTVRWPDGSVQRVPTSARPVTLERRFQAPPGDSAITLATDSPVPPERPPQDIRDLRLRVADATLTSPEALPALPTG
jgi:phosphoglycerol transferase